MRLQVGSGLSNWLGGKLAKFYFLERLRTCYLDDFEVIQNGNC